MPGVDGAMFDELVVDHRLEGPTDRGVVFIEGVVGGGGDVCGREGAQAGKDRGFGEVGAPGGGEEVGELGFVEGRVIGVHGARCRSTGFNHSAVEEGSIGGVVHDMVGYLVEVSWLVVWWWRW